MFFKMHEKMHQFILLCMSVKAEVTNNKATKNTIICHAVKHKRNASIILEDDGYYYRQYVQINTFITGNSISSISKQNFECVNNTYLFRLH